MGLENISENYRLAYRLACEELKKVDPPAQARRSGGEWEAQKGQVFLLFLGCKFTLDVASGEINYFKQEGEVPLWAKIILLHYFNTAKGTPLKEELITFRQLPGGNVYYPNFTKRVTGRLAREFGKNPAAFLAAGEKLGGEKAPYGDASFKLQALPYVPLVFVLWEEAEGFPAEGNVLFDASVGDYLSTEDAIVLCQEVTGMLVNLNQGREAWGV